MAIITRITAEHAQYMTPPDNKFEHVYSAVEDGMPVVCWRTPDGWTHQAVYENGAFNIRTSVPKF